MKLKNSLTGIRVLSSFIAITMGAHAADGTWDSGAATQNWQDTANWNPDGVVGFNTDVFNNLNTATFSTTGSGNIDLGDLINIRDIRFGSGAGDANAFIIGDANDTLNLSNAATPGTSGIALMGTGVTSTQQIGVAGTTIRLSTTASSQYWFTNNSTTSAAKLNIGGNITTAAASGISVLTLDGTNGGTISGNITNGGTANMAITKIGTGSWTLSGTNTYSGVTNINGGTLVIGANNTLSTTGAVVMNSTGSGSTPATLNLSNFSQTIGSLSILNTNATNADTILIGAGKTLTVNGGVTIGNNSAGNTSLANVSGAGSFVVTNSGGTFQVGGATGGVGSTLYNKATLDMSGLSAFTANLGTTGIFRVGDTSEHSIAGFESRAILAATSTITAGSINIGSESGHFTAVNTLKLGSTINTLNANTINIGSGTGRSSGEISFNSSTGTVKVRAADGTSRANMNVTNVTLGTSVAITAVFDTTGHSADLLFNVLNIGRRTAGGGATTATMSFDTGTLDATTVNLGVRSTGSVTSTLNIGGGTANLGVVNMANGGSVNAIMNLTGGTVTMGGNIVRVNTASNAATINLNGSSLNMAGFNIGSTNAITFDAQSGTLSNLGQLNNGGALTKTTAGTLILSGTNTYTGATTVSDGILSAGKIAVSGGNSHLGNASSSVTLGSAGTQGTLSYTGNADTYTRGFTIGGAGGGRLNVTTSGQTLTVGTGNVTGTGTFTVGGAGNTSINSNLTQSGGLTKVDAGILTISGASNSYTGATNVNGGKLSVASTGIINSTSGVSIGGGEFNYNSSTALTKSVTFSGTGGTLSGTGTINNAVNVTAGNTLGIGNSPGTMNFGSDLTINGTFVYEMFGGTTSADLGNVAGNLTLGGVLDLVQLGAYTVGDKFTLLSYSGSLSNTFAGLADEATFSDAEGMWKIDYNDISGGQNTGELHSKFVTVTAIPEPTAALLGGLGVLALLRRRRN